MKLFILTFFLFLSSVSFGKKHIIFLHNRFLENHTINDAHPKYGRVELDSVIFKFEKAGFSVIANKRDSSSSIESVIKRVSFQIDSLSKMNGTRDSITVIGTSKGGYIAQMVSSEIKNPRINFVFIGCFQESDIVEFPDINYCGNILTIYEKSDPYGVSAIQRKNQSNFLIPHFKEIELNTGLMHGFLYKALDVWIEPCIEWANNSYK